jgi:hypothetical protein
VGYVPLITRLIYIGVRTCRPIPKGMFICQYIGEVITDAEAERRGEEYDRKVNLLKQTDTGNHIPLRPRLFP